VSKILDLKGKPSDKEKRVVMTLIFTMPENLPDDKAGPVLMGGVNLSVSLGNLHRGVHIRITKETVDEIMADVSAEDPT